MKITSIEAIPYVLPTRRPHKLAMATINEHTLLLIRITTDEGLVGLGEVAVIAHYGEETIDAIKVLIDRHLTPHLIGKDPAQFELILALMDRVIKGNRYAKAGIEMACVDLAAKKLGVPSYALFGGKVRDRIPVLLVLGAGDIAADIAEAEAKLADKTHRLFLVKIGQGDPKENVARAAAVKAALGDRASVRVDVNQGWDEATATWGIAQLEAAGIDAVEQPVRRDNIDAMRRLTTRFAVPIMADEPIETPQDALKYATGHAADAFSVKLTKHGGMVNTKKVAAIAEAAGISLFGGTMLESGVSTSAYAQLFATLPNMQWGCQLFGPLLFSDDIVISPVRYDNFDLIVPDGPGFGMDIDEDKLRFYRRDN